MIRACALVLCLWACSTPEERGSSVRPVRELPEDHRAVIEAYVAGGEAWERELEVLANEPELMRFAVDNLVIEMVGCWDRLAREGNARDKQGFLRAQNQLVRLGPNSADVLAELLAVADGVVAELASQTLRSIGKRSLEPVARLLDAETLRGRQRAARLLGELPHGGVGEESVRQRLISAAWSDPEWIVRAEAAESLGARGSKAAETTPTRLALERVLADSDSTVVERAAMALARLGDPGAVPALADTLDRAVLEGWPRLVSVAEAVLRSLTGVRGIKDSRGWREWWRQRPTRPATQKGAK